MKIIKPSYEILTPINREEILKTIEVAGRTCYKSESKITEDSASKFVTMLINRGHCFDTETEILTLNGWKKYYEIVDSDLFATLNENGMLEYKKSEGFIEYTYKGKMVKVDSPFVNLLITDKHKLYVCKTTTKNGRKKNNYELIDADSLIEISHSYLKNCNGYLGINKNGSGIHLDVLRLLGFSIGDGNIYKNNLTFHIPSGRKTEFLKLICNNIGVNLSLHNNKDIHNTFRIGLNDIKLKEYKELFLNIYNSNNEKRIPNRLLNEMNTEECLALLEGLQQSDGHITKDKSCYYSTTSEELKNQFQQLCLHAGYSSNRGKDIDLSKVDTGYNSKGIVTKMSVIKRYNKPEISIGKSSRGKINVIDDWEGKVWCVNIPPYHNVYVRRNGKPVWSGNCAMIEHYNVTVKFICDRAISHEIVRHRIASYAQESTRYCNYSNDKFGNEITVIDPTTAFEWDIPNNPTDCEKYSWWSQACRESEKAYFNMLKFGATPQEARSVLPNSLKTEIVVTMNLREWRHFFTLRTASVAHPQMREVAIPLLNDMKRILPEIYGDIELK